MIHWLVQSSDHSPDFQVGAPLGGVLHPGEQAKLATLKTEKRRRDWLLGRWTAKRLIQSIVQEHLAQTLALPAIEIRNGSKGDPVVNGQLSMVNGQWSTDNGQSSIDNLQAFLTLSISHAHGHAFCAVVERPHWPIGADIEWVEQRSPVFVADYFTAAEQALVAQAADEAMRDVLVTAVWSAKEAVLKALHLGLTVDTCSVECLIEPVAQRPSAWTPFVVRCDNGRLPQPAPQFSGWWRTWENFVLTLVVEEEGG
ncbi:MAG: 4'-phosphopantetheinyl transferase superfamily protein [Chloroflexi bacterium]|nr:4'-phosphopantetheinyl transferase superfamily protein [Chloroflexota bacterium]